jgi:hypothetical protein
LEDYGIDACLLQIVQLSYQRSLHLFGRHSTELPIDCLNPCPTKLTLRLKRLGLKACQHPHAHQKSQNLSHDMSVIAHKDKTIILNMLNF